jgi:hypothetical protein
MQAGLTLLCSGHFDEAFERVNLNQVARSDLFDINLVNHWDACYYCTNHDNWVSGLVDYRFWGELLFG